MTTWAAAPTTSPAFTPARVAKGLSGVLTVLLATASVGLEAMAIPASRLPALKAREVLRLLAKVGYTQERQRGSPRKLVASGRQTIFFAFHDRATVPRRALRSMLVNRAGLTDDEIEDLL